MTGFFCPNNISTQFFQIHIFGAALLSSLQLKDPGCVLLKGLFSDFV